MAWDPWAGGPLRVPSHVSAGNVNGIISLSGVFLVLLFFHPSGLEGNVIIPDTLEVQLSLIDEYRAMGNMGPKGLGVGLQGCTTLGVPVTS